MKKTWKRLLALTLVLIMSGAAAPLGELAQQEWNLPSWLSVDGLSVTASAAETLTEGNWSYTVENGGANIVSYNGSATEIVIPATLGGYSVRTAGTGGWGSLSGMSRITVEGAIEKLYIRFYYDGPETLVISGNVQCLYFSFNASFAGYSISDVYVPASVSYIEHPDMWFGSFYWHVTPGSYAERYANEKGYETFADYNSPPGSGLPFWGDIDDDGLYNGWESNKYALIGRKSVDLPNADPYKSDVYIQVDWMRGCKPSDSALNMVKESFANSGAGYGNKGIILHTIPGNELTFVEKTTWYEEGNINEFRQYFDGFASNEAKAMTYRYCVFGNKFEFLLKNNDSKVVSGQCFGTTFFVSMGFDMWNDTAVAGTFMHELGHSLGLPHRGINGFADLGYFSVMNYWYQKFIVQYGYYRLDDFNDWRNLNFKNGFVEGSGVGFYQDYSDAVSHSEMTEETSQIAYNEHVKASDWEYIISDDNKVTITGYKGTATELTVPSTLYGYPVTEIGNQAFFYNGALTSVILPSTVKTIGEWAFGGNAALRSIHIPESVTSIAESAFHNCTSRQLKLCCTVAKGVVENWARENSWFTFVLCDGTNHGVAKPITVSFNAQGGSVSPASETMTYIVYGSKEGLASYSFLPTPTRAGYAFDGWYTEPNGNGTKYGPTVGSSPFAEDITLYAAWIANTETITPMLAAGYGFSLALKSNGTVWAWGYNDCGQLGDNSTTNRRTPVQTHGLASITAIAAGDRHSLALKKDGTVWAWGAAYNGKLGNNMTTGDQTTPVQVQGLGGVGFLTDIIAIAGGGYHSLALKRDGTVWAWGCNDYGQLGDNSTTQRNTPVQVQGLTDIIAIAAGWGHSVAVKSDGTVWAWGRNQFGQLGNNSTVNRLVPVQILTDSVAIEAGYAHTIALKRDGTVWAWGWNSYGQLGDNSITNRLTPVQILTGVAAIAAGEDFSIALKSDSTVWEWGRSDSSRYGDNSAMNTLMPANVQGLTGVITIAAADWHSLALKSDGTVWAWGYNASGQLGDNSLIDRLTPVQVVDAGGLGWLNLFNDASTANYTLTLNSNGGTVTPTSVTQTQGTTYTLPTPTRSDYTFTGWTLSGGGSLSGSVYTFGTSNGTATAQWTPNATNYSVTVNSGTGGGSYAANATVSITANAATSGKAFDKWTSADGVIFANANSVSTTFTMPVKNVTVTATYKDAPPSKGIFGTNPKWYGAWWHYILFFIGFGFIWMWF